MFPRLVLFAQKVFGFLERRKYLWLLLGICLASIAYIICPKEPSYGGHVAIYWLERQATGNSSEPLNAFLVMGDEGALYLAREAVAKPSAFAPWLDQGRALLPRFLWGSGQTQLHLHDPGLPYHALKLLSAMGPKGKAASPVIMRALQEELVKSGLGYKEPSVDQWELYTALAKIGSEDPKVIDTMLSCARIWGLLPPWPESIGRFTPAVHARMGSLWKTAEEPDSFGTAAATVLLASIAGEDDTVFRRLNIVPKDGGDVPQKARLATLMLCSFTNRTDQIAHAAVWCFTHRSGLDTFATRYSRGLDLPTLDVWLKDNAKTSHVVQDVMFQALRDSTNRERDSLVRILYSLRFVNELINTRLDELLKDGDAEVVASIQAADLRMEKDSRRSISRLDSEDIGIQKIALRRVGELGVRGKAAVPKLQGLLNHADKDVRALAKEALEKIEGNRRQRGKP